ncbi:UNVERIFIED_CONTAM: hypothetical protein Slati_1935200 [Sesamum latifolium]|uniref:Uncharacterized protein n=1 Tax=Sesamum latifolium TaxID=2727402 RepID=A0AAW2X302_9LAMI
MGEVSFHWGRRSAVGIWSIFQSRTKVKKGGLLPVRRIPLGQKLLFASCKAVFEIGPAMAATSA